MSSCIHIFTKGKKQGEQCGKRVVYKEEQMCATHYKPPKKEDVGYIYHICVTDRGVPKRIGPFYSEKEMKKQIGLICDEEQVIYQGTMMKKL